MRSSTANLAVAAWLCIAGGLACASNEDGEERSELSVTSQDACDNEQGVATHLFSQFSDAQLAQLKSGIEHGAIIVQRSGCAINVLEECRVKSAVNGSYRYQRSTPRSGSLLLGDETTANAMFPRSDALFRDAFSNDRVVKVNYASVGRYEWTSAEIAADELEGEDCEKATHIVARAQVGAATIERIGKGPNPVDSSLLMRVENRDSCAHTAILANKMPPDRCDNLLAIELAPIGAFVPVTGELPMALPWDDAGCKQGTVGVSGKTLEQGMRPSEGCVQFDSRSEVNLADRAALQCKLGKKPSCETALAYADAFYLGWSHYIADLSESAYLLDLSCRGGEQNACALLSTRIRRALGVRADDKKRARLAREACEQGVPRGCAELGIIYQHGSGGVSRDFKSAIALFEKACAGGDGLGCLLRGEVFRSGTMNHRKNLKRAATYFKRACNMGGSGDCTDYATMMLQGSGGVAKDITRAVAMYETECAKGDWRACFELGTWMLEAAAKDSAKATRAIEYLEKACARSESDACTTLGRAYHLGQWGRKKSLARAVALYGLACRAGRGSGCGNLGFLYGNDVEGVERDNAKALRFDKMACDLGDLFGCNNLARDYADGIGGSEPNMKAAVELLRRACDGGIASGCTNLGRWYVLGRGVVKNLRLAQKYSKIACDKDEMSGCLTLGVLHSLGEGGVKKDTKLAATLFKKGCENGELNACNRLGLALISGPSTSTKNKAYALELFSRACEGGIVQACNNATDLSNR